MTAHDIARELLRQLSADVTIRSAAIDIYGEPPRFYLDDDDPDDGAPHVIATPEGSEGGLGPDAIHTVSLAVSARDFEGEGTAPDVERGSDGTRFLIPASERLDRLAAAVWDAIPAATPGAILDGRSADWAFTGYQPLRFAVFTLTYRLIKSFGD